MKKSYKLFIFDFDGTVGDTTECVVESYQLTLGQNKLPFFDRGKIIHYMGIPLKEVFITLTDGKYQDDYYEKLVAEYREIYRKLLIQKTHIFPGVRETLKILKQRDIKTAIATSKKTEFAILSCEHLKILQYFDLLVGEDLVVHKKPLPETLELILNKLVIDSSDAIMIGDTTFDIEMGKKCGMDTVAVTWGSHSKKLLEEVSPTYIVDNFTELQKYIPQSR